MDKNTVFDMSKRPERPRMYLLFPIYLLSLIFTVCRGLKTTKINMEGLKPPFLVLSRHMSYIDYFVAFRAFFPNRTNFVSDLEGFIYTEKPCRKLGMIAKRKFTNDISLVRNLAHVVQKNKDIAVLYPEARYCNVGTGNGLPESAGKLAKLLKVPVVTISMNGNYLLSPIWNPRPRFGVTIHAEIEQVLTAEQIHVLSVQEIHDKINAKFIYDEYAYQKERQIRIRKRWRANGLHHPLYLCPNCRTEYRMRGEGTKLSCMACGKVWELTELGELRAQDGETEFPHIPDWYEYERKAVREELEAGCYLAETPVQVHRLRGSGGFIKLGRGELRHDRSGFRLRYRQDGSEVELVILPIEMSSMHNEYHYRGKGVCLSLSTPDDTFFLYPESKDISVTKLMFAAEELYAMERERTMAAK